MKRETVFEEIVPELCSYLALTLLTQRFLREGMVGRSGVGWWGELMGRVGLIRGSTQGRRRRDVRDVN